MTNDGLDDIYHNGDASMMMIMQIVTDHYFTSLTKMIHMMLTVTYLLVLLDMSAHRTAKNRAAVPKSATLFSIVIIIILVVIIVVIILLGVSISIIIIIVIIIIIIIIIGSTSMPLFSLAWPLSMKRGARGKMTPSTRCITSSQA